MDKYDPKNIDPRPKRRRDKDNPYRLFTVGIDTDCPHFYVEFIDSHGIKVCTEVWRYKEKGLTLCEKVRPTNGIVRYLVKNGADERT